MNTTMLNRRTFAGALLAATAASLVATRAASAKDYTKGDPLKVALVLHGNLGDRSFFDSAAAGMKKAEAELPIKATIIEAGIDRGRWQPAIADAADGDFDVIIAGTWDMTPFVQDLSKQYPNKKFILFDDSPDYSTGKYPNVLGVTYRTSTAAYLAGYAAAKISKTGKLGEILAVEASTILEFVVGFEQGAKAANPNIEVKRAIAGGFADPAKGKELALAQFAQGVDVVFQIAGATGIGALQAARDQGKLAIGVDSDQAEIFATTDAPQANAIVTSVQKKVGQSLFTALQQTLNGTAPYGKSVVLGLADDAVGIAKNKFYEKLVPAEVRTEVDKQEAQIIAGQIKVVTAMK